MKNIYEFTRQKVINVAQTCEHLFVIYCFLALSGYLLFVFINPIVAIDPYHTDTQLRVLSIVLILMFLGLFVIKRVVEIPIFLYYLFWFLVVTINQPFFFSFMVFKNNFDYLWSLNALLATGFLLIIFDWITALILLFIGAIGGWLLYYFTTDIIVYSEKLPIFTTSFISLLIYGALFSYRRKTQEEIRVALENLKLQSGAIAHEMRTPLANVMMMGVNLRQKMGLIEKAFVKKGPLDPDSQEDIKDVYDISQDLVETAKDSQNLINLLLANLKQDFDNIPRKVLSMRQSLEHTLQAFAFNPHEKNKVHINIENDFDFKGNRDLIMHIFFNLLKNSLYFIQAAGKGEIFITLRSDETCHKVIFKDTGPGIEKYRLSKLFTPFYSQRPHGTGIGLSFCKKAIESMGGTIKVASLFGEHTTFTLSFPKIKKVSVQ